MKKRFLRDIAEIQTGPFGSQLHKEDYVDVGTPIVTVEHLGCRVFSEQNLPMVSDTDKSRLSKYVLKKGDIVFSRVGSVDRCSFVDQKHDGWMFSGRCLRVRPSEEVDSLFLYYFFCLNTTKEFVRSIAVGATMPSINTKLLGEVEVVCPEIEEQRKIADILSKIDDKIEENQKINENLEQQISSIYANFCESKSWKPCELGSIIDVKDGTHDSPKPQTSGYLLVTSKHLLPYGVDRITPNRITEKDFKKINERSLVEQGDVLMSMIGTIGLISFVTEREIDYAIKNVALFKTSRTPNLAYYFLTFLKSNKTQQYIEMCLAGSTQKYISLGELRKMPIPVPNSETLECFNEIVSPMYQAIILNSKENYAFAALRDSMLPKLMSGEIDVSKIDI